VATIASVILTAIGHEAGRAKEAREAVQPALQQRGRAQRRRPAVAAERNGKLLVALAQRLLQPEGAGMRGEERGAELRDVLRASAGCILSAQSMARRNSTL